MCDECGTHSNGKGLFSSYHSSLKREFENENIVMNDDANTTLKREAYQKDPSYDNLMALGSALNFQLRYRDSLKIYLEAVKKYNTYDAHRQLAHVYMKTLKLNKAYEEFEYCLKDTIDLLDIEYRLGLVSFYQGKFLNAASHFEKCFSLALEIPDMYVSALYWYYISLSYGGGNLDKFYDYRKQYKNDYKTHVGYDIFVRLVSNEIDLDKANLEGDFISTLQKTCLYYGLAAYFKKEPRRHNMYLKLTLSLEDDWASFSAIGAYLDYKGNL